MERLTFFTECLESGLRNAASITCQKRGWRNRCLDQKCDYRRQRRACNRSELRSGNVARLTYKQRKKLKSSTFALAGRKYPIPDKAHGRAALQRVSQFGTAAQKSKVRSADKKK